MQKNADKCFCMFFVLVWLFAGCKATALKAPMQFEAKPYYSGSDSTVVYFEFKFQSVQKQTLYFDWFKLYFSESCFSYFRPKRMDARDIQSMKNCTENSLLIENSEGFFSSISHLYSQPVVGPHAGSFSLPNADMVKPIKVMVQTKWVVVQSLTVPIEVLYPTQETQKIRIYYVYGPKRKKEVVCSDWFDVLSLPYKYKK